MAEEFSAEQVRERHIRDMGPDLGPVCHELSNELTWLYAKWIQYRQLYGHSEGRVDFLNKVGGHFFRIVQDALWDDVILHIARFTDPIQSMGKYNLTLLRLPELINDPILKSDVEDLIKTALSVSLFARDWRNRKLAHNDLSLALENGVKPLQGISREKVESALLAFRAVLNRLDLHYWKSETFYEDFITTGGEGEDVIRYLRAGIKAEEGRMERLRQGKPLPEDFQREHEA